MKKRRTKKPYGKIGGSVKGKISGDPTPGYRTGKSGSFKLNSPYYKPKPVKAKPVRIKRRV